MQLPLPARDARTNQGSLVAHPKGCKEVPGLPHPPIPRPCMPLPHLHLGDTLFPITVPSHTCNRKALEEMHMHMLYPS